MLRARRLTRRPTSLLVAVVVLSSAVAARAATLFDPAFRFRVLRTEHFHIYFHQGEDRLAARLSAIAEDAWHSLERPLGTRPPAMTHLVIADQTEQANGFATPLPYDTIVIYATWPRSAEFDTDDWLRLVITHEFTHIVHLDRSESWARAVRGIFGRTAVAFPNLFLPTWQVEGLATFEESMITGEGRLHAGDFRVIVDEASRRRALEPIDRVNGGLTDWPTGQGPYAYGVAFHQYLVDRFGAAKLADLAEATARRVPYTAPPVFERIFGEPLATLWKEFEQTLTDGVPEESPSDTPIKRLTHHGFVAGGPRFDGASDAVIYARRTPDDFPTLERVLANGETKTLTTRYFGTTTAVGTSTIVFDQLEVRRNVALLSDLYVLNRTDGRVVRLAGTARLRDPDVAPDGQTIAAVREGLGRRELIMGRLAVGGHIVDTITLVSDPDTQFNTPRWSPDGHRIAVERHRLGHDPEIVVVDPASHGIRVVAEVGGARVAMPAWRPDGRAILAAVARSDEVFNLYEFSVDESARPRQLTDLTSGATWPDVSRDGRNIVFVGYTTAGYDIFSMPYPTAPRDAHLAPPVIRSTAAQAPVELPHPADPYSPFGTLAPTSWSPVVDWTSDQIRFGAATAGRDVLGYHNYAVSATWLASSPEGAPTPNRAVPDWFVSYAYDRWRPTLFAAASLETTFFEGPPTAAGTPAATTRRERAAQAGVILPFVHARSSHSALGSLFRAVDEYTLVDRQIDRSRTAIRAAWRSNTARTYGYSISPEDGVTGGTTVELVRRSLGAAGDATVATADLRAYLPGVRPHQIVALRAAGGISSGDPVMGRTFLLGGPGPDSSVVDFDSGAVSLLRGFAAESFAGTHVALVNADYRWPLGRPQRGYESWPIFLHTLHAAVFADAGHTWTQSFRLADAKLAGGIELSANLVAGFYFPFTVTTGVAWGHDGNDTRRDGLLGYVRIGRSF